ncbi:hypothetical protein HPB47_023378 [Ixodes persulcatus]|uniref:Uncharacterized protein n=1 Tax=Ixodes persulcatus TaxID=34615 RepID=A0AC60Q753_IXOPE|nr:hypothetical protein HPB47_023378 [Ixodes persulcatus]
MSTRAGFNGRLIAEVQKRPALWNMWVGDFRDTDVREALWEEVVAALAPDRCTVQQAKSRWRNLRDTFCKKWKAALRSNKSWTHGTVYGKEWAYFSRLTFLLECLNTQRVTAVTTVNNDVKPELQEPENILPLQVFVPAYDEAVEETPPCPAEDASAGPFSGAEASPGTSNASASTEPPRATGQDSVNLPTASTSVFRFRKTRYKKHRLGDKVDEEEAPEERPTACLKPLDPVTHFLLALEPYLKKTPESMLPQLQMELLNTAAAYSRGEYPEPLFPRQ